MKGVEIKIIRLGSGRVALYREQGSKSIYWHHMPVRQAEKAVRDGIVSIGFSHNIRAVSV
jgi:hypothetical protein